MFMSNLCSKTDTFAKIMSMFVFLMLGVLFFAMSQIDTMYIDCNKALRKCTIGEIKNNQVIVNREIKYYEIKGHYLHNSPKGYFSMFDNQPNTVFVLKIKQKNKDENLMLPFITRLDILQADKLYNDILHKGIKIAQENHHNLFWLISSVLSFIMFLISLFSLIINSKKENNI